LVNLRKRFDPQSHFILFFFRDLSSLHPPLKFFSESIQLAADIRVYLQYLFDLVGGYVGQSLLDFIVFVHLLIKGQFKLDYFIYLLFKSLVYF